MFKKIFSALAVLSLLSLLLVSGLSAASASDEAITKSIQHKIDEWVTNDPLDRPDIKVVTDNGTVYLRGTVRSLEMAEEAEGFARSTEGVVKIVNQIDVLSH